MEKQESGCWLYLGPRPFGDYGTFWLLGKTMGAHRASYLIFKGEIPKGKIVRHTCDNCPCINPEHLILGTHKENGEDRAKRDRSASGTRNGAVTHLNSRPRGAKNGSKTHPEKLLRGEAWKIAHQDRNLIGEKHGMAKITENDVRTIRYLCIDGWPFEVLAKIFGICSVMIRLIHARKNWAHVI